MYLGRLLQGQSTAARCMPKDHTFAQKAICSAESLNNARMLIDLNKDCGLKSALQKSDRPTKGLLCRIVFGNQDNHPKLLQSIFKSSI